MSVWLGAVLTILLFIVLAKPVGLYLAKCYDESSPFLEKVFAPTENVIFKLCGVKKGNQSWKQYALTMLFVNVCMIVVVYLVFRFQNYLPLNPNGIRAMDPSLAFNTVISFITNTNLQHYSGETALSYLSQMIGITYLMVVAPATTLALVMSFIRALAGKEIGNFYVDFIKSLTRVYLPVSFFFALIFVALGVPQTFSASVTATTIEGGQQVIARGPIASLLAIKQFGNNGGGAFGVNSAHPFENPGQFANMLQIFLLLIIPASLPFTYGKIVGNLKQGRVLFASMLIIFLIGFVATTAAELQGNPIYDQAGIDASQGNMEGKEVRFGPVMSALFVTATTAADTGAVNTMHDSLTPLGGMVPLVNMMLNTVFGSVGAGFMNIIMYALIAVFISGLMVGRTPEFLGKKIEGKEMKLIALALLVVPFTILVFSAIAVSTDVGKVAISNPGFHGLTQVIYEYTSSVANNGSGFEGLGDNTLFWNVSTGIAMFIGRYFPLLAIYAVAASLREKTTTPETIGTFRTDNGLFGGIFVGTILLVGALTFLPVLVLGPIAEFLTM